jgi:membrane fusion protein (multidrug efflux system)
MTFPKMPRFYSILLTPLLVTSAMGQGAKGKSPSGPLPSELYEVKVEPFARTLSTVGTLRANESVTLVSELSRRLVKIEVKEGSLVKKGDLLFKLDDSDLVAELGEIDARLNLAETNKKRVDRLLPSKAISQQEFDVSTAELKILEAQRNTQAVQISKTEIRAPFSGRVGVRQVSEGAFVSPTTPLVTLQDVSRIKVDFPLPERYSTDVKQGQNFTFTVAGNGQVFAGKVTVIEPAIEAATRSLLVRGLCETPKGLLPGGFAEVSLTLDVATNGFMVPSQSIVPSQRGQGVYVIEGGKAKLVPVEIGARTEDKVQILRGVGAGDLVATTNLLRMRPGVEVSSAKSP